MENKDIKAVVKKMAGLAKLKFREEDTSVFASKFQAVLSYVKKLEELNTDQVDPTSHVVDFEAILREDKILPSLYSGEILAAAPERDGGFVQVPKVIDAS